MIATIATWEGFFSIFALFGILFIILSKWQDKPKLILIIGIFASIFWIAYGAFVGSYGGITAEIIIILSILISLFRKQKAVQLF